MQTVETNTQTADELLRCRSKTKTSGKSAVCEQMFTRMGCGIAE